MTIKSDNLTLDGTDERLLALLREDARMPVTALAKALKLSRAAVYTRLNRLQRQGPIQSFTVKLSQFIENAKKQKFVRKDIESMVAAGMIYLYFSGLIQNRVELEKVLGIKLTDEKFRRTLVKEALNVFSNGVLS